MLLIKANTPTLTLSFICADCPFYIVIEASGSDSTHDGEKLHNFLEVAMTSLLVTDGTVATEESKIKVRVRICSIFLTLNKSHEKTKSKLEVCFFFCCCSCFTVQKLLKTQ